MDYNGYKKTDNKNQLAAYSEIHSINTRKKCNSYQPLSILISCQTGPYYFSGVKLSSWSYRELNPSMKQFNWL
jgi:hypothetical protein